MLQDFRLAIRLLRATPIVTVIAALSLALGIGANTALFSLINGLVLRSLPVDQPQRLAVVSGGIPTFPFVPQLPGYPYRVWTALADRAAGFDGVCACRLSRFDIAQHGELQPVDGVYVSGAFFTTLGVHPALGQTFTAEADTPGGGRSGAIVVISYAFWQRHFAGRADVVGAPLVIERAPFTVVGVTAPEFSGTEVGRSFDVAVPIASAAMMGRSNILDAWIFRILVRLKPGQPIEQATATLRTLQPQIREAAGIDAAPDLDVLRSPFTLLPAASGTSALRQRYASPLFVLLGVVALVLLVACANIANLLLARATARRHEFSVRLALGASRWHLARQLLVESLMLSAMGAAAGLLFARWASHLVLASMSSAVNRVILDVPLDWRVVGFTTTIAVITALLLARYLVSKPHASLPSMP